MASTTHTPYEIPANPTVAARQPRAAALLTFFETFYAVSDDPVAHEKYARSFTADATLIIGGKRGKGYDGTFTFKFKKKNDCFFLIFSGNSPWSSMSLILLFDAAWRAGGYRQFCFYHTGIIHVFISYTRPSHNVLLLVASPPKKI